jgi:hypothetical protein
MKEIKASLGRFKTMEDLKKFLWEDNERPYHEKGYRRKVGINKVRNAFVEEFNSKVWFFSQGYGMEYYFSEEEKNRKIG